MTPPQLPAEPENIALYRELQTIRMAWVAFITIFAMFVAGFVCFLWAAFHLPGQGTSKVVLGGLDALLVWPMKTIVSYLFPASSTSAISS